MRRWLLCGWLLAAAAGCSEKHVYEIDFRQAQGFEWTGRLRVVKEKTSRLGPFLSMEESSRVVSIELPSEDGRTGSVDPDGYQEVPVASIGPRSPYGMQILGTQEIWKGGGLVVVMTPAAEQAVAEGAEARSITGVAPASRRCTPAISEQNFTTRPTTAPAMVARPVPTELRPYAEHMDELTLTDWWAIGLQESREVTLRFDLSEQGLEIIASGPAGAEGPEVVEVRSTDGRLLKRYERTPLSVRDVTTRAQNDE